MASVTRARRKVKGAGAAQGLRGLPHRCPQALPGARTLSRRFGFAPSIQLLVALAGALGLSSQAFAADKNYKVLQVGTAAAVHMRSGASVNSRVIGYMPPGTVVASAGDCRDSWCPIVFKNLSGWAFRAYLEETGEPATPFAPPPEEAQAPQAPNAQSDSFKVAPRTPATAVRVQEFPGEGMPVVGYLPPDATGISDLGRCVQQWCRVRYQEMEGWVLQSELAREPDSDEKAKDAAELAQPAPQASGDAGGVTPAALKPGEPASPDGKPSQPAMAAAVPLPSGDGPVQYFIAGLSASAWLPLREEPSDTSRVLGALPPDASGIEDMKLCVRQWCLVRYGETTGFVQRRFLARPLREAGATYRVDGADADEGLKVFSFPGKDAEIVGSIPSYASGILPIGDCDQEWCHIRYLGLVGWVSTSGLALETVPRG